MRGQFGAESTPARRDGADRTRQFMRRDVLYQGGMEAGCLERTFVVSRVVPLRALRRGDDGPDEQQHRQHRKRGERVHAPLRERHGLEGFVRGQRLVPARDRGRPSLRLAHLRDRVGVRDAPRDRRRIRSLNLRHAEPRAGRSLDPRRARAPVTPRTDAGDIKKETRKTREKNASLDRPSFLSYARRLVTRCPRSVPPRTSKGRHMGTVPRL